MSESIGIQLEDVVKRNRAHTGFEIPSFQRRHALKIGDLVKLVFLSDFEGGERMWVRVTKVLDYSEAEHTLGRYEGMLESDPVLTKMSRGDSVSFGARNVCNIVPGSFES